MAKTYCEISILISKSVASNPLPNYDIDKNLLNADILKGFYRNLLTAAIHFSISI